MSGDLAEIVKDDQAFDGERYWIDVHRSGDFATSSQLELLATVEDSSLDDLLEASPLQGEVLRRLRDALGQGPVPEDVLARQAARREARSVRPSCRNCGVIGGSTHHHFVNKWMLRELSNYAAKWADRTKNCIPLCVDCHSALHQRDDTDKSIVDLLMPEEMAFADAALTALADEHPKLLLLIARGDEGTYETRVVRDWINDKFTPR